MTVNTDELRQLAEAPWSDLVESVALRALWKQRLVEAADELDRLRVEVVTLLEIVEEYEMGDVNYGPFPGGDPRLFKPDEEVCTPAEIEAWKVACAAWSAGEQVDRGPSCATMGDASVWAGTGFGVGTYQLKREVNA